MSSESPRVLVVDDSPLLRRMVRDALESEGFRVVGEAGDGWSAVERVHALDPDLVTLDIAMPGLGGLETLGYVMSESPRPVVMLSGLDEHDGADLTIRALELGAVDFVRKPSWAERVDEPTLRSRLVQAARAAVRGNLAPLMRPSPAERPWRPRAPSRSASPSRPGVVDASQLLVIGASTGGPRVLCELIPQLPPLPDAAVVIVQHMPAGFTASLARRLAHLSGREVREAGDGDVLDAGSVLVAPGGQHLRFTRDAARRVRIALDQSAAVRGVRPSLDVTLRSAGETFGVRATAVVLTGMGRDGAVGCRAVRERGGSVIVQSPASCVVAGMPQAVLAESGADVIAEPADLAASVMRVVDTARAL